MTITELLFSSADPGVSQIILVVLGVLGAVLMAYGIFLEKERLQDAVFAVGALCLMIYSVSIANWIFTATFGVFFLGSLWEYISIVSGLHKHVCYPCVSAKKKLKK